MKIQTLLLGEYASSAFYVYTIPSDNATTDYLSLQDLYRLFFHHPASDIHPLLHTLYMRYPHHFYHDQKNQCYLAKQHVLTLARSLQLFALAEFCALTHEELVHRIADPLFAITALILCPPKRMDMEVEWFPAPSCCTSTYTHVSRIPPVMSSRSTRLDYFSAHKQQNDHSWSRHFLPLHPIVGWDRAWRAQKQQQAVIECRQRNLVFHHSGRKRKSSSLDDRRLPPPCREKKSRSAYNNNLDLLATQATKMKGLPLSPEISPPPPILSLPPISTGSPFYSSSFILPSIRNVLSDI
ncbi:hypothetical protein BC941DRAFT_473865 [Chlamydoabsidia padenii]|nr:hypothetical protein BC941DRAFT_473865 [Chlamydoabsidia padenii]